MAPRTETIIDTVKRNLKLLRQENGLKMREIAAVLQMKENTYSIWESSSKRTLPSLETLAEIAAVYNVSLEFLFRTAAENGAPGTAIAASTDADRIYGEKYLNELNAEEKITVMKLRRLSNADRQKINEKIDSILKEHKLPEE